MKEKRDYPLFIFDRSNYSTYPFDYIVCLDRDYGFIARVVLFRDAEAWNELKNKISEIENSDFMYHLHHLRTGGIVVIVEDFLYYFEITPKAKTRVKSLLKKGFKKYIHTEVEKNAFGDLDIENQIKQQELTIERAKSNYDDLVARSSKIEADYNIALAEATLDTLKKFKDNQEYFKIFNN